MSIPRDFIDLLLTKVDLVDLIKLQVPLPKKTGSNYFGRCPFHTEKSASFSVSQPKQFYYCFGCGAHGNAIDFMMQHDRLSFPEAIEALARQTGLEVPKTVTQATKSDNLNDLYDMAENAMHYYYNQMRQSQRAIDYLKQRGISGKTAQQFNLGYAQPGWSHILDTLGQTPADKKKLLDTGLIIKKPDANDYYDRFRDRIIFPIRDYRGRYIGFGGRILDKGEPKYLNSPETPLFQKGHELYGLYQALQSNRQLDKVLIVEGYMDVIALFQHDITYAVATLGTATTPHHLQRLFRYSSNLIFCFDGDQAGRTAAWRALQVLFPLMQDSLQIQFLFLPDGEDPDSLVQKEGKASFEERVNKAHSLSTFFFQTLSQQADMASMEGRARFATQALNYIKQLSANLFQSILIEELSKRARIDINELKQQVKGKEAPKNSPPLQATTTIKLPTSIRLAITLLLQHPHLAGLIKTPLPTNTLPGHTFLCQLLETIQKSPNITTGALLEYWRGQKEEALLAKLAQIDPIVPETGIENEFLGAIKQITLSTYDEEINRLLAKAAQEGLSDEEKVALTSWITTKKSLYSS